MVIAFVTCTARLGFIHARKPKVIAQGHQIFNQLPLYELETLHPCYNPEV